MGSMMTSISFNWMIIIPMAFSPVAYLVGRLGLTWLKFKHTTIIVQAISLIAVLAAFVPFYNSLILYTSQQSLDFAVDSILLRADAISLLMIFSILILGLMVLLFSGHYMENESGEEKFYAMLLAMLGMMIGLVCARDIFNLWMWFEGMAVSSYLLVAFYREQTLSLEAGFKYLVQSAAGSVFILMGIAVVLANSGSLDLTAIQSGNIPWVNANHLASMAAAGLFIAGFGVKTALVPMHTWLPDAHSQAPSGISAILSGVVIEVGLIAMLRALGAVMHPENWRLLFIVFGAINILFGNLMALRQTMIKRMLAYSSLSHIGYIVVGLGVSLYPGGDTAAQGAFFHIFTHMLMKGLAFLSVGALIYALYLRNGSHHSLSIDDLSGAAGKYPMAALCLSIALLALGGLPPFAGFMSKWQIFTGGFQTNNNWIMSLMIFMALNSVLSLGYYAPLVNRLYRREPSTAVLNGKPIPLMVVFPLMCMTLAVITLGFFPGLMDWLTIPAARDFFVLVGK